MGKIPHISSLDARMISQSKLIKLKSGRWQELELTVFFVCEKLSEHLCGTKCPLA